MINKAKMDVSGSHPPMAVAKNPDTTNEIET